MPQTILVQDYMTASPHSIGVTLSLSDAANMMKAFKIRHLPVLDGRALVGIVSDRDVQMVESMEGIDPDEVPIEEAMSQAPYTVTPSTPLEVAARHLARHKLGSAVVVDANQKVVGVFTVTDGMRALADLLGRQPADATLAAAVTEKRKAAPKRAARRA
ncbi:MAG: CBS domain-containing protein [Myxococcaceae bacterium]|jgi:acetoin utilization protein AcuB|nr:CBS domain-containing protein [Myxococcaceae bacterium]MCA3016907.1 CBS domain-containing protein [Myxococcaceae bacterium]